MGVLLQGGIGDTIRVSLTPEPNGDRTPGSHRRAGNPSKPWPARVHADGHSPAPVAVVPPAPTSQELAQKIQSHIRHRMPEWRKQRTGVEDMTVAVMGCVVNGRG